MAMNGHVHGGNARTAIPAIRILDRVVDTLVGIALFGEMIVVIGNVLGRALFDMPLLWANEIAGLSLATIAFIGGAVAYRRDQHISVRTIIEMFPKGLHAALCASSDWLVLLVALVSGIESIPLVQARWGELTPLLQLRGAWLALPLTLGMFAMAIYALERLSRQPVRAVAISGICIAILTAAAIAVHLLWVPSLDTGPAVTAALIVVLATVLLGLPVGFALVLATLIFLYAQNSAYLVALPQNMVDGMSGFVLLALPFFILAGFVMEGGGISRRLVVFIAALVGRLRGGLLQVVVLSTYVVSGISGSKAADVAAVGLVMRNMLDEEGYERGEAAAVLAASAAMGECVPPSLAMLVLGSVTSLSMSALFAAGLLPAAVIAVCVMALVFFRSRGKVRQPGRRVSPAALVRLGWQAILPFSMPVLLFYGIFSGFATPTEVSAFAVAYGFILACFVYREVNFEVLGRIVVDASSVAAMVLFTLAAAQSFSWVLSAAQLPHALATLVSNMSGSITIFLLGSMAALIILGSLLEGLPAILILAPLLLPIATDIGINDLHFGILMLIAMGIGAFLPPLGVGFYIACTVVRAPMDDSTRRMMSYVVVLVIGLLLVAFVPWFTLSVPRLLGLAP